MEGLGIFANIFAFIVVLLFVGSFSVGYLIFRRLDSSSSGIRSYRGFLLHEKISAVLMSLSFFSVIIISISLLDLGFVSNLTGFIESIFLTIAGIKFSPDLNVLGGYIMRSIFVTSGLLILSVLSTEFFNHVRGVRNDWKLFKLGLLGTLATPLIITILLDVPVSAVKIFFNPFLAFEVFLAFLGFSASLFLLELVYRKSFIPFMSKKLASGS